MNSFTQADFKEMQNFFLSGATASYNFRKEQLQLLKQAIKKYEVAITDALYNDLRKPAAETYTTEIGFVYAEISYVLKHLQLWMKPKTVASPLVIFPSSSRVVYEPLGVNLIISPWNYPVQLLLTPLIGSISGGNCAVLKPSEFNKSTTTVLKEMVEDTFDASYITLVEGNGEQVVPQLMENHFDHVFFTGSVAVGKEIAILAAKNLTPVTLELGGKSPCIVDKNVNLHVAAQRITWGKFSNAGQTCVAPDYLLVHENKKPELLAAIQKCITRFYGKDVQQSPDYGRIINEKRFDKLTGYLQQGEIITGGITSKNDLYISPTLMQNVQSSQPLMKEEIFGPILPIQTFKTHQEVLDIIKQNANPLALYLFTNNPEIEKLYVNKVSFGGGCINNTLVHLGNPGLPFGGVGNSGTGRYHGKHSFQTFTRRKAVVKTATWADPSVKYPPYKGKLKLLKWFLK